VQSFYTALLSFELQSSLQRCAWSHATEMWSSQTNINASAMSIFSHLSLTRCCITY